MDIESVRVHQLGPDDWHRFRRIRLLALAEAPYAFGSTLAWARARTDQDWRELLAARTQFLATAGDHDLGTVGAVAESDVAHLISMWVAPEARGTGVADLLVRSVIDWAAATGYLGIQLEVSDGNIAAERLYHRHGFRRTGVAGAISSDDARLEFEMRLTLPARPQTVWRAVDDGPCTLGS
ncbi:GNAT family N-acetyltransferase [Nocardia bhagyanarayanae]|uniref:Ribosomal protein S18 acetylase RimI-like enzyme n=1 Tax=Nocardia bhagyanarayanae TaxID=1215925 RepID=A0A543FH60_9NOCA|nr:GNAT family N-acetyltransferase [Nocardia bhagyanarayanae]TQM33177.1 ribosomal protein S18 acetylase RimI-like enzyme [Nocardia bhagyanarayanae]